MEGVVEHLHPADAREVAEMVAEAAAAGGRLEIRGGGALSDYGRAHLDEGAAVLEMGGLDRVVDYDPEEFVLTVQAGVRLRDVEALLASENQMLAFEPPDLGPAFGKAPGLNRIGGIVAANLSGPRRVSAGSARDHFLGLQGVSGQGLAFKAGGRVVKNVTGFDLPKLMAGSWGGLAALTHVTLRTFPRPAEAATALFYGLPDADAVAAMGRVLARPLGVSGAAHLPRLTADRLPLLVARNSAVTAFRLEGFGPSVSARLQGLRALLAEIGEPEIATGDDARMFWRSVGELAPFGVRDGALWRVALPPAAAAEFTAAFPEPEAETMIDWGGALVWLQLRETAAARVRHAVAQLGGHATLVRAAGALATPAFPPLEPGEARLTERVRAAFDPQAVFVDRRQAQPAEAAR